MIRRSHRQIGVLHFRIIKLFWGFPFFPFCLITFDREESSNLLLWQYEVGFQCSQDKVREWGERRGRCSRFNKKTLHIGSFLECKILHIDTHTYTRTLFQLHKQKPYSEINTSQYSSNINKYSRQSAFCD